RPRADRRERLRQQTLADAGCRAAAPDQRLPRPNRGAGLAVARRRRRPRGSGLFARHRAAADCVSAMTSRALVLSAALLCATACHEAPAKTAEAHAQQADSYAAQHKLTEASIEYRNALKGLPTRADLHYKLGEDLPATAATGTRHAVT